MKNDGKRSYEEISDIVSAFNYQLSKKYPDLKKSLASDGPDVFDQFGNQKEKKKPRDTDAEDADNVLRTLGALRNVVEKDGRVLPRVNVAIDYFKVEFFWSFQQNESRTEKLLSFLRLDDVFSNHDSGGGRDNFSERWDVAVGTFFLLRPNEFAAKKGYDDYFILEMSGQGCMAFEARGGNWGELISFTNSVLHEGKRVDLAGDDMDGICPLDELKKKIRDHCYTSNFRARKSLKVCNETFTLASCPELLGDGRVLVRDWKKGYSATWGKKGRNIEFQIYDKKAERLGRGIRTLLESSIRYEMRFFTERCDMVLLMLEVAYQKGCVGTLYGCLFRWLIEFKEESGFSEENLYKAPIWSKFSELIGTAESISVPVRQADMEACISRSRSWISNQWSSTAKVLIGIDPYYLIRVLAGAVRANYQKFGISAQEYSMIATFLHYHPELGLFDREAIRKNVEEFIHEYAPDESERHTGLYDYFRY